MRMLQKLRDEILETGVSRQDVIFLDKHYDNLITGDGSLPLNSFTKLKSKQNFDIVLKKIDEKLEEFKQNETVITVEVLVEKVNKLSPYIGRLSNIVATVDVSKDGYDRLFKEPILEYYNEEDELKSALDLPTEEALTKTEIFSRFNNERVTELVKAYNALENKESNLMTDLRLVIQYGYRLEDIVDECKHAENSVTVNVAQLLHESNDKVLGLYEEFKTKLTLPDYPANIILFELGRELTK